MKSCCLLPIYAAACVFENSVFRLSVELYLSLVFSSSASSSRHIIFLEFNIETFANGVVFFRPVLFDCSAFIVLSCFSHPKKWVLVRRTIKRKLFRLLLSQTHGKLKADTETNCKFCSYFVTHSIWTTMLTRGGSVGTSWSACKQMAKLKMQQHRDDVWWNFSVQPFHTIHVVLQFFCSPDTSISQTELGFGQSWSVPSNVARAKSEPTNCMDRKKMGNIFLNFKRILSIIITPTELSLFAYTRELVHGINDTLFD